MAAESTELIRLVRAGLPRRQSESGQQNQNPHPCRQINHHQGGAQNPRARRRDFQRARAQDAKPGAGPPEVSPELAQATARARLVGLVKTGGATIT